MARSAEHGSPKEASYFSGRNEHLLELLPAGARRILDVGCGDGALGRALKAARPGAVVHGLDREREALARAARCFDAVFEADLDRGVPPLDGPYDAILCGDVLEHLVDPWTVLRELAGALGREGRVVASIPNVRYYKVLRDLALRGRFTYRERGVLDATHLRFFTRYEMGRLFESAGLEIVGEKARLGGGNLLLRAADVLLGGNLEGLRAVQYTLLGRKRDT